MSGWPSTVASSGPYDLPSAMPAARRPDELIRLFGRDKKAVDGITFVLDGPNGLETVTGVSSRRPSSRRLRGCNRDG